MGLPQFPTHANGVIPVLILNTIWSVVSLKDMTRSALRYAGFKSNDPNVENELSTVRYYPLSRIGQQRKVANTKFQTWRKSRTTRIRNGGSNGRAAEREDAEMPAECSVCLSKFRDRDEVSMVRFCEHLFHRSCLQMWFDKNSTSSCPLCRTIV